MTDNEIEVAVAELEKFLVGKEWQLLTSGWTWYSTSIAPESFIKLQECGKCLPIANYGCENTIYSSQYMNQVARFWHDVTHITEGKDFKTANELDVIAAQYTELSNAGVSENAREVFWADMKGQVMYYRDHGKFVENQREFVLNILKA